MKHKVKQDDLNYVYSDIDLTLLKGYGISNRVPANYIYLIKKLGFIPKVDIFTGNVSSTKI